MLLTDVDDRRSWKIIQELDLALIRKSFENEIASNRSLKALAGGAPREFAKHAEAAYRRFLFVCLKNPDEKIVPDEKIDAFWHKHILFTEHYTQTCSRLFGRYLHHRPDAKSIRAGKRSGWLYGGLSKNQEKV